MLYAGGEGQAKAGIMSNNANLCVKLLIPGAMVDSLAEKIDECPLNRGRKYCLHTIGTAKTVRYTE